jgi:TIR domain
MSFHVFLSHSCTDKPAVEDLARRLVNEGIQAFLDKWHLIPGDPWQAALEKALAESETCAVFMGPSGFGPWQNEEMRAATGLRKDLPGTGLIDRCASSTAIGTGVCPGRRRFCRHQTG